MGGRNLYNMVVYWTRGTLQGVAILFAGGTILQTFLAACGLTPAQIGVHATVTNIAFVAVNVLFSGRADRRIGGVKKPLALWAVPLALGYGATASLLLLRGLPTQILFAAALVIGVLQYGAYGLYSLFDYKIAYNLIDRKYFGIYSSVVGILIGVLSAGVGTLFGTLTGRFPYYTVVTVGFAAAMGMQLLGGGVCLLQKETVPEAETREKRAERPNPLKMKSFTVMILPNLFRGVSTGIVSMAAVLALDRGFSEGDTALMVTMASVGVLLGCGLFAVLNGKVMSPRLIVVAGSVLMAVGPFLFLGGMGWFLGCYLVLQLGRCFVDYAVPTVLFEVVPYELAGTYHAWRMVLHTAGTAVGSMVTGCLTGAVAAEWILAAAVLLQLISGFAYYFTPCMRPARPVPEIK